MCCYYGIVSGIFLKHLWVIVPVGLIWKLRLVLGSEKIFQKFELTLSCSNLLRQLKMQKNDLGQKIQVIIAGKGLKIRE